MGHHTMTSEEIEYAIESRHERKVDAIDARFIRGDLDRAEYEKAMQDAADEVERQYAEARKTWPEAFR
jgi:hypothetical protein